MTAEDGNVLLRNSETLHLPTVGVFTPYREPCHRASGSGERLHISETLRLDAHLSQVAELEPGTVHFTNNYHDRFA